MNKLTLTGLLYCNLSGQARHIRHTLLHRLYHQVIRRSHRLHTRRALYQLSSSGSRPWLVPLAAVMREDFVLLDEYTTNHANIEDNFPHRTGMPRHDFSYGGANVTVRDVIRNLRNLLMTAEIRSRFHNCNMMYIAISHFIRSGLAYGCANL